MPPAAPKKAQMLGPRAFGNSCHQSNGGTITSGPDPGPWDHRCCRARAPGTPLTTTVDIALVAARTRHRIQEIDQVVDPRSAAALQIVVRPARRPT
jgi:hypothetical protein